MAHAASAVCTASAASVSATLLTYARCDERRLSLELLPFLFLSDLLLTLVFGCNIGCCDGCGCSADIVRALQVIWQSLPLPLLCRRVTETANCVCDLYVERLVPCCMRCNGCRVPLV